MSEENVDLVKRAYATFTETLEVPFEGVAEDGDSTGPERRPT